jgi:anti-sigma regulatory factor (Ser/Thr protein kinase)
MIQTVPSAGVTNGERFERVGLYAAAEVVADTRREFADWLDRCFDLDPDQSSDVVLAINEALANAAEFAYILAERPGTVDVRAEYDSAGQQLTVWISDYGLWRTQAASRSRNRGRGIPLMHALSDGVEIDTSARGTQVCMRWTGVARR